MGKPQRDAKGHFIKASAEPIEVPSEIAEKIEEGNIIAVPVNGAETPVSETVAQTPTLPILTAVNGVLGAIRRNHPEVPNVSVVVGAQGATRRGMVHGHFFPNKWANPDFADAETDNDTIHEVMLSGESLQRGAVATLGTLLHESAHAIANVRGVRDTSNNNRYHNKRFKAIGEELGLTLEDAPTLGWSLTTVPEETQEKYKAEIDALAKVLTTYRRPPEREIKKPRKSTKFSIVCDCDDPVTVSKQWFERNEGALKCDNCLSDYRVAE